GIDNDSRITILFLAIEGPASLVGDIAGYFWSGNQFPRSQIPRSNEREMLYMDITRLSRFGVEDVAGTLAHEFQHLIHWNYDRSEEVWINEGLAEYATFRNGFRLTNSPSLFLDSPDFTLMSWSRHPRDYARAFLWIAYLADHYGGDSLLRSIVANPNPGISALQMVLAPRAPGVTVADIFRNWVVANYLDAGAGDVLFGYPSLDLAALRPTETFAFLPVGSRNTAVNTYAADYYVFEGGENLLINLDGPNNQPDFEARIIKLRANANPEVLDFPLDANNDGGLSVPDFGVGIDRVVLIPYYLQNPNSASSTEYQFSADGSGGPMAFNDTLQYHDQESRTIITLGMPSPLLNNEHLDSFAVRFTPSSNGILMGAEFGVWDRAGAGGSVRFYVYDDDGSENHYPANKLDSVDVASVSGAPGTITFNQVDFSARNIQVRKGEEFHLAWVLMNAGIGDTVFAVLDTAKVATERSAVLVRERNRWAHFTAGLNFFMRAIISVPADPTVPRLTAGLLQNPVFSQALDIFAIGEKPLSSASVEGKFIIGNSTKTLRFRAVGDSGSVFVDDSFRLSSAGAAKLIVSARHEFGVAVGSDTLELNVDFIEPQKGGQLFSLDKNVSVILPPKVIAKPTYFITIPAQDDLETNVTNTLIPTALGYTFGPADLTFAKMVELSIHYNNDDIAMQSENDLTICQFENGEWLPMGGELYRSNKTITTLIGRTGTYRLFVKQFLPESSDEAAPLTFFLNQNYPNPFNPNTSIKFGLPKFHHVTLRIINLKGQTISSLIDQDMPAGEYVFDWDGTDDKKVPVASGVYLYQLQAGNYVNTRKLLLVK
ncbi:MAG TPA: T9SS type A sorting domain-containing protein, partial [bacterium]